MINIFQMAQEGINIFNPSYSPIPDEVIKANNQQRPLPPLPSMTTEIDLGDGNIMCTIMSQNKS